MEIGSILLGFALDIVGDVIKSWISDKRTEVKQTAVQDELRRIVKEVAKENKLNANELYKETQRVSEQVISRIPGIEQDKGLFKKSIVIDCGTTDKSRILLQALNDTLDEIKQEAHQNEMTFDSNNTFGIKIIGELPPEQDETEDITKEENDEPLAYSRELLKNLRKNIEESGKMRK